MRAHEDTIHRSSLTTRTCRTKFWSGGPCKPYDDESAILWGKLNFLAPLALQRDAAAGRPTELGALWVCVVKWMAVRIGLRMGTGA